MELPYDRFFPLDINTATRICSWTKDEWYKPTPWAKQKLVRHQECNRPFPVWNQQANHEPWTRCAKHSQPEEWRDRKRRKG